MTAPGRGFSPMEYVGGETEEWALVGGGGGGFDPLEERVYRKGKGPKIVEVVDGGQDVV